MMSVSGKRLNIILLTVFTIPLVMDTSEGHRLPCDTEQFHCSNKCIPRRYFCDNSIDCADSSDEKYCDFNAYSRVCPVEEGKEWQLCDDGRRCYPSSWRCDGRIDCPDGSDERECDNPIQHVRGVPAAQQQLIDTLMEVRHTSNSLNRWGSDLPRIATALYLTDQDLIDLQNRTGQEMAYEISLQLLSKFAFKKKIQTSELSLYVNALLVSCMDPRDFFGIDVVAELRSRVTHKNNSNPFTLLTLCNAKDSMTQEDVDRVLAAFDAHHRPKWTDTQALATMAMACLSTHPNLDIDGTTLTRLTAELKSKQQKNGTIQTLRTTALVVQALLATESYRTDFDLEGATKYIVQKIRNENESISVTDAYYVLPVLGSKNFAKINTDHCMEMDKTVSGFEVLMDLRETEAQRVQIQCSVFIGSGMNFIRTWKLKVPANYTFYDILETIGSMEPEYKVQYDVIEGKPYVGGLSKYVDDAEEEMFWFTYKQTLGTSEKPQLVEDSPVDIVVNQNEELILWYRSGQWID